MKMPKLATATMKSMAQATTWKECRGLDQPFTRDRRGGGACLPLASGTTHLQLLLHRSICKMEVGGRQAVHGLLLQAAWQGDPRTAHFRRQMAGGGPSRVLGESCVCPGHSSDATALTLLEGVQPAGPRAQERHLPGPQRGHGRDHPQGGVRTLFTHQETSHMQEDPHEDEALIPRETEGKFAGKVDPRWYDHVKL